MEEEIADLKKQSEMDINELLESLPPGIFSLYSLYSFFSVYFFKSSAYVFKLLSTIKAGSYLSVVHQLYRDNSLF